MEDRNEWRKQHEQLMQLILQNMNKNNNDAKQKKIIKNEIILFMN